MRSRFLKKQYVRSAIVAVAIIAVLAVLVALKISRKDESQYTIDEPYLIPNSETYLHGLRNGVREIKIPEEILARMTTRAVLLSVLEYKYFQDAIS